MKHLLTLLIISMSSGFAQDYEFTVKIIPQVAPPVHKITRGAEEAFLIDRPNEDKGGTIIQFKAVPEFKANGTNYEEIEKRRKYEWDVGDNLLIQDKKTQVAKCKTKETTWGKEIQIKIEAKSVIKYGLSKKEYPVSADADKSLIAPLIKLKSVTFSKAGGGSGFKILDEFRGKSVPLPEYVKDRNTEDQSPFGYHSGKSPSYKAEFIALPESMETLLVKCTGDIFDSDETSISIAPGGKAEGAVSGKKVIEKECKIGPESDPVNWSFSVFSVKLTRKEVMVSPKYYILLDPGVGGDPWEDLLKVAFEKWSLSGTKTHSDLVYQIRGGIAAANYNFNYPSSKPNYVTQGVYPHVVRIGSLVGDFLRTTPYIICEESAALLEHASDVLGSGGCISRGISWKGGIGHAYCLFQGKVYDPLPGNSGADISFTEKEYIKKYTQNEDVKVENIQFEFKK